MIYLDNNATTRPDPRVLDRVREVAEDCFGNPGSPHAAGRRARQVLEDAREEVASLLGATPGGVVFTSGATEASNLALYGLARGRGVVAAPAGEHPATEEVLSRVHAEGWRRAEIPLDADGRIGGVADLPWEDVRLLTLIFAHNETGVVQDTSEVAALCERHRVPWHLDATQAVGKVPVDFAGLGCTTLSFAAHKFHGPRGVGCLLVREGATVHPRQFGGHQESGRRAGTEAVALAAGLAEALRLAVEEMPEWTSRMRAARDRLEAGLRTVAPECVVHGAAAGRLPNTSCVGFPGRDGQALVVALDLAGVCVSVGSACASGSPEPAPVLLAMGVPEGLARASLRFSVSHETTAAEIDGAISAAARVLSQ